MGQRISHPLQVIKYTHYDLVSNTFRYNQQVKPAFEVGNIEVYHPAGVNSTRNFKIKKDEVDPFWKNRENTQQIMK